MRLSLPLSLSLALALGSSSSAVAGSSVAACVPQTTSVSALRTAHLVVNDGEGIAAVTMDGNGDVKMDFASSSSPSFASLHVTPLDLAAIDAGIGAGGAALRCDSARFAEGNVFTMPSGMRCRCQDGLWVNWPAGDDLPCYVSEAMVDQGGLGLPYAGPLSINKADVDIVPTFTADVADACNAVTDDGYFRRFGRQHCLFISTVEASFTDARWHCMAAGGHLPIDETNPFVYWAPSGLPSSRSGIAPFSASVDSPITMRIDGLADVEGSASPSTTPDKFACDFAQDNVGPPPALGSRGRVALVNAAGNRVFVSNDGGASFDAGHNFALVDNAPLAGQDESHVAISDDRLIVIGRNALLGNTPTIKVSGDDFATSTNLYDSARSNAVEDGAFVEPTFDPLNPDVVVFIRSVVTLSPKVRVSVDGGQHFYRTPDYPGNDNELNDVIVRGTTIIAAKNSGNMYVSNDLGLSGHEVHRTTTGLGDINMKTLCATDSGSRILAGAGSVLIASTDDGATWTTVPSGAGDIASTLPSGNVDRCDFSTDNIVVLLTSNNDMLRSTDGGVTWATVTLPAAGNFQSLEMNADGLAYACGVNGYLLRSVDHGATWTALDLTDIDEDWLTRDLHCSVW